MNEAHNILEYLAHVQCVSVLKVLKEHIGQRDDSFACLFWLASVVNLRSSYLRTRIPNRTLARVRICLAKIVVDKLEIGICATSNCGRLMFAYSEQWGEMEMDASSFFCFLN